MSLSAREQEALERIADGIAGSDSNLVAMLGTFTRLTSGEQMPEGEQVHGSRGLPRAMVLKRASPRLSWLPVAVLLIVAALIAVGLAINGGGERSRCARVNGLVCVSQVSPSVRHAG